MTAPLRGVYDMAGPLWEEWPEPVTGNKQTVKTFGLDSYIPEVERFAKERNLTIVEQRADIRRRSGGFVRKARCSCDRLAAVEIEFEGTDTANFKNCGFGSRGDGMLGRVYKEESR